MDFNCFSPERFLFLSTGVSWWIIEIPSVPCITRLWPAVCEGKRNGIRWSSKIYSIKPFHISQQQVMKRVSRNAYRIYMKRWNWAYYIMYPLSWAYSNNNLIIIFAYCLKATDFESEVDYKWIVHDGFTRLTEVK